MKKNIIFILFSRGTLAGSEKVVLNWCKSINKNKYHVVVLIKKGPVWEIFNKETPETELINYSFQGGNFRDYCKTFRRLVAHKIIWNMNSIFDYPFPAILASWLCTRGDIDIMHHNFLKKVSPAKPKRWFKVIPGIELWQTKIRMEFFFMHNILAKKILCVSDDIKKCLINDWGVFASKINITRIGIDTEIFYPDDNKRAEMIRNFHLNNDTKIFLAVNRFHKQKRIDRLLGAFLLLLKKGPSADLLIIGNGELMPDYKRRVEANPLLRDHVHFLGHCDNVQNYLQGADYLLLASDWEGLGLVILEAMACGAIPIVTDSYGPRFLKENIFISDRDVFDFHKKIRTVLSLPQDAVHKIKGKNIEFIRKSFNLKEQVQSDLAAFSII